jgi:ferritin
MISEKMEKALNDQLNYELYSAYSYAGIAAHFDHIALDGAAHWMRIQVQEELVHASKFYQFILDVGAKVTLQAIAQPKLETATPLKAFEDVLEHERSVTRRINKLVDIALAESDHATNTFLQWFITEQVEEEKNADDIVQKLRLVGGDSQGLFMIDRELAGRAPEPEDAAGA